MRLEGTKADLVSAAAGLSVGAIYTLCSNFARDGIAALRGAKSSTRSDVEKRDRRIPFTLEQELALALAEIARGGVDRKGIPLTYGSL